jgi:hypothetical protein
VLAVVAALVPAVAVVGLAIASSGGISGYSGNPGTNFGQDCNACHAGGVAPTVTLSGPTTVPPGSVTTYALTLTGGQQTTGGLGVSVTRGELAVTDPLTQLLDREITHFIPKADGGSGITWTFDFQAPTAPTTVTMYAAGNSTNDGQGQNGDAASTDSLMISVAIADNPGETSGLGLDPLLVTGFDPGTGNIAMSYGVACETTDNNIYYGPLDQVSTYGWSGEVCGIGISGAYPTFNPGSESVFFVVVGNKGADEGSYGTDFQTGASGERPAFVANACGQTQNLAATCIEP